MATVPASDIRKAAPGPHPGAVAVVSAVLFALSLAVLGNSAAGTRFPHPDDSPSAMQAYFLANAAHAQLCALFQFGAAIALGIFTAAATNRLHSLGIRATGVRIALFGGWLAAFNSLLVASLIWVLAQSGVAQDAAVAHAIYLFAFALGGTGYAAAIGLLCAGLSLPSLFSGLLPRWLAICGVLADSFSLEFRSMQIRIGYDIAFQTSANVPMNLMLYVHPSRQADLRASRKALGVSQISGYIVSH